MKKKIIFIGPFLIPITGNSIVNDVIFEKIAQNSSFQIKRINTSYPEFNEENGKFSFLKLLFYLSSNLQIYKQIGAKIVYISIGQTYLGVLKNALPMFLAKLFRQKLIVHLHGNELGSNYAKASTFKKSIFQFFLKLPNKAIVPSPYLKDNLLPFLKEENIVVLPNFAADTIIASKKEIERKNYSHIKLLFLSNLMTEKGIFELLRALKLLQKKGVFIPTELYGTIDKKIEIELLTIIDSLGKDVTYKGMATNFEKKRALIHNNTFILPSYNEGLPLAVLEAMATGNLIITTQLPGLKDILTNSENSFLVKKKNSQEIVEVLENINRNPEVYTDFYKKNYSQILENFTEKKFAERLFKIINEL